MTDLAQPFVSVIIPVFNDEERLKHCLKALVHQTYGQSRYEIIVVDNGSDYPEQIQRVVESCANAVFATERKPGSYAARNRGISLAKGKILAFTDADCIPAPDWLEVGVRILSETPNCGLAAGQIQLFFQNPERPTMVELYESVRALPQQEFVEVHHYGATANVMTTRAVMEQVGVFNAQLKSSGDVEWGQRVYAQGYRQVYAEAMRVQHPARSSWQELYTRTRRLAGGHYDLRQQAASGWKRHMVFLRTLLPNLVPPVFFFFNTLLDDRLTSLEAKLKVSSVMLLVRYISAWEMLRLWLGGVSSRA